MDLDWIWKSVLIVIGGTLLLRMAGRKSISQMTLAQTVIMIGIGSLLIQPLAGKNIWITLGVGALLVITLIIIEYAQIKSDRVEAFITGKSKILIENGVLHEKNLKKLRFTVDQLEMKLRQQNVTSFEDVKWATLEPNGQIGFELMAESKPVTKKDFNLLQQTIEQLMQSLNTSAVPTNSAPPSQKPDLFEEVAANSHTNEPPQHLQ